MPIELWDQQPDGSALLIVPPFRDRDRFIHQPLLKTLSSKKRRWRENRRNTEWKKKREEGVINMVRWEGSKTRKRNKSRKGNEETDLCSFLKIQRI
jgi:hypothetical protein